MTARPYRLLPAIAAFVLFLMAGSLLVRWIAGSDPAMTPLQEMQCVQYAIAFPAQPPEELSPPILEELLGRLDPQLRPIAGRVTVLSFSSDEGGFQLRATHAGNPGKTYAVDLYGVR